VWAEAAKALAKYPEAVVTALDIGGYPVSIRQATSRYDAETGCMPVAWPPAFAVAEGPASMLCHYHDEKLWNMTMLQVIPEGAGPVNPLNCFCFGFLRRGVGVLR
jgi:hypothetical protein